MSDQVLDNCEASFKAADERRQKASTRFFGDTGLMALVCRHDQLLSALVFSVSLRLSFLVSYPFVLLHSCCASFAHTIVQQHSLVFPSSLRLLFSISIMHLSVLRNVVLLLGSSAVLQALTIPVAG